MNDDVQDRSNDAAVIRVVRIASLAPLLAIALACSLIPSARSCLVDGFNLLVAGDLENLQLWAAGLGPWAMLTTLMLMIAQAIVAPIPAVLVTATNSLLFGPFWGGVYSIVSANIAAAICYGLARGFGAGLVDRMTTSAVASQMESYFRENGAITIVVARLIPFVPFDPISFLAGLFRVPFWQFFWATMIGQIPAGMTYSYLVHQVAEPNMVGVYLLSGFVALCLVGLILRRIYFRPRNDKP